MVDEMRKAFEEWIDEEDPFPCTTLEWDHYDPNVKIVFFRAQGDWNQEIIKEMQTFLRQYKKKVLVNRYVNRGEEQ